METSKQKDKIEVFIRSRKKLVVVLAFLAACALLTVIVIIPQFSALSINQVKRLAKAEEVKILQKSYSTLNSRTDEALNSQLITVENALPSNKNIISVYDSISNIALKHEMVIDGFTIKVGGLYSKDPKKSQQEQLSVLGVPFLRVIVNISSQNINDLTRFINNLYESLPLAEIKVLNASVNEATVEVNFYYKPYNLQALTGEDVITPLSTQEEQVLNKINGWRN